MTIKEKTNRSFNEEHRQRLTSIHIKKRIMAYGPNKKIRIVQIMMNTSSWISKLLFSCSLTKLLFNWTFYLKNVSAKPDKTKQRLGENKSYFLESNYWEYRACSIFNNNQLVEIKIVCWRDCQFNFRIEYINRVILFLETPMSSGPFGRIPFM